MVLLAYVQMFLLIFSAGATTCGISRSCNQQSATVRASGRYQDGSTYHDIALPLSYQEVLSPYDHCESIVVTAIFGAYDVLRISPSLESEGCDCCVAFVDRVTRDFLRRGHMHELRHSSKIWHIVVVNELPFADSVVRSQRFVKILVHIFFPRARYSLWVDAKFILLRNPAALFAKLQDQTSGISAFRHPRRRNTKEEFRHLFSRGLYDCDRMAAQYEKYFHHEDWAGSSDLVDTGIIFRNHSNPLINHFSCKWFEELFCYSFRDQLSFSYMAEKFSLEFGSTIKLKPWSKSKAFLGQQSHARHRRPHNRRLRGICKQYLEIMES